jgi:hypothetical protein
MIPKVNKILPIIVPAIKMTDLKLLEVLDKITSKNKKPTDKEHETVVKSWLLI